MKKSLISIVSPCFNSAKYLEKAISSVINQTYPKIELIIVDGASTDDTIEILKRYEDKYPDKIKWISEPDSVIADAWAKGLKMARGKILGMLACDETYEPDAIDTVVKFFELNPDAYFVFGECNHINEKDEIIGKVPTKDFNLEETINDNCYMATPSAFFKREVVRKKSVKTHLLINREK